MILPDYSEYLKQPGMLEYIEQEWLKNPAGHYMHSGIINGVIKNYNIKSVVEVGCGTGNVAKQLQGVLYTGVDANEDCIKLAREKNPDKLFHCADIRTYTPATAGLVFTFGVLKHFGLHEWTSIFQRIASFGEYFVFDMPICNEVKDDGTEHHHVWVTVIWLHKQCKEAGLAVVQTHYLNKDEFCFVTKRI